MVLKITLVTNLKRCFFASISRDRAAVARWAHNPKVTGSIPVLATKVTNLVAFLFWGCLMMYIQEGAT